MEGKEEKTSVAIYWIMFVVSLLLLVINAALVYLEGSKVVYIINLAVWSLSLIFNVWKIRKEKNKQLNPSL